MFEDVGVPVFTHSSLLSVDQTTEAHALAESLSAKDMGNFVCGDVRVGEHALAGTLRFFARATLDGEQFGEAVLRRYFEAALLTTYSTRNLLTTQRYEAAVFHHGIYVPQGLVGEVCREAGVRVVNWNPAYRKQTFIFSHGDTYHHTLMSEPTQSWEGISLSPQQDDDLGEYLGSRWHGTNDWIWFHDRPVHDRQAIEAEIGIDFGKPTVGLLTNVMWDAQLHYPANAFPSMLDWVIHTVKYFEGRPDLQLLIRIHPAELRGRIPSRQLLVEELHNALGRLPANVFIIPPESQASTYVAMEACDSVLIYGTKTGVELASMGIPVIVAGEAWIRNKGLTQDAASVAEYNSLLDALPLGHRMSADQVERAKRYAYHFFFRRMIPLPFFEPTDGSRLFSLAVEVVGQLKPGADRGLDVVCRGIVAGTPFVYDPSATKSGSVE